MSKISRARKNKLFAVLTLTLGITISNFGYPAAIWRDSWYYLANARSIFTTDYPGFYTWSREPGYPFLLRMVAFAKSDFLISSVQACLLVFALIIIVNPITAARKKSILTLILGVLAVLTPQYFGYSSMLLKQPLMVIVAALTVPALSLSMGSNKLSPRRLLVTAVGGTFLATLIAVASAYFWISLSPAIGLAAYLNHRDKQHRSEIKRSKSILVLVVVTFGSFFCLYSTFQAAQGVLSIFRNRAVTEGTEGQALPQVSNVEALTTFLHDPFAGVMDAQQSASILLMLRGGSNGMGSEVFENDLLTASQLHPDHKCGLRDNYGASEYEEKFFAYGDYLELNCRSNSIMSLLRTLKPIGFLYYQFCMVLLIAVIPYLLLRRKYLDVLYFVAPLTFLAVYSLSGRYTNDRYGLVLFPFGLAAANILLSDGSQMLRSQFGFISGSIQDKKSHTADY